MKLVASLFVLVSSQVGLRGMEPLSMSIVARQIGRPSLSAAEDDVFHRKVMLSSAPCMVRMVTPE